MQAGELQIQSCKKEEIAQGIVSIGDISASGNTIKQSLLEFSGEMQPSIINVFIDINICLYSLIILRKQHLFGIRRSFSRINNDQIEFHPRYT